ncbi:MAG: 2-C-methyl-D-erythritol 2,4-cyclodiphosphate synthase [Clostridia bacterium]|nr:2-C-methyl-D-erythritol 2,4-cyclodiphosphate synthase [Clostridia bacterium]
MSEKVKIIILCAGVGKRTGLGYNKLFYPLGAKTVLETTADAFADAGFGDIVFVINPADEAAVREIADGRGICVVYGGATRTESARNGLNAAEGCDIAVIHDGARPFVSAKIIRDSVESAKKYGSGIAAVAAVDTVKYVGGDGKVVTLPRSNLICTQTPQSFRYGEIKAAYGKFEGTATDDCEVYEKADYTPKFVEGSAENRKITVAEDLHGLNPDESKIGVGFDVHPLKEGRRLILGGVDIPHRLGLDGHSDADVLAHAVTDALLSAASLPDIGVIFPDSDMKFKDADSIILMQTAYKRVLSEGYRVGNVSAVIMAQKPKLAGFIPLMRKRIAEALGTDTDNVNISATTTENLGIVGEEKGIAASATCLLKRTAHKF